MRLTLLLLLAAMPLADLMPRAEWDPGAEAWSVASRYQVRQRTSDFFSRSRISVVRRS